MALSDFDAQFFWPAIKQFVIDKGVEPISLGEPENETWPKIFAAMAANGTPLSMGMGEGQIMRAVKAAVEAGAAFPQMPQLASWYSARDHATQDATFVALGDSLTAGANRPKAQGWPSQLAPLITKKPVSLASFIGDNAMTLAPGGFATFDPRLTIGNAWAIDRGFKALSAGYWLSDGAGAVLAFDPGAGVSFDTIDVYFGQYSGGPTLPLTRDALVAVGNLVMANATSRVFKASFTVPLAAHTLQVGGLVAGGYFAGMILRNSGQKRIHLVNAGWYGGTTTDANKSATFETLDGLKAIAPNLTTIMLGTNDKEQALAPATYLANLQAIGNAAKLSGSVLFIGPPYGNLATYGTEAAQDAFYANVATAATAIGAGYFNLRTRTGWTSFAAAQAAGFMDADGVHITQLGYADIAAALAAILNA